MNIKKRRKTREFMMAIFYQMDARGDLDGVDKDIYMADVNSFEAEYCEILFDGFIGNHANIDKMIESSATSWRLERFARVDLSIVRLAITEIIYGGVLKAVAISEAVELAKKYGQEQSPNFVNAILRQCSEKMMDYE